MEQEIMNEECNSYYEQVGAYYDMDLRQYENRYCANYTLQFIKESFIKETEKYSFKNALEIGFGLGTDLCYFAEKYPDRKFCGLDVSEGMYRYTVKKIETEGYGNVCVKKGSIEDIATFFPDQRFDLIYAYFGAINTVENLNEAVDALKRALAPGGKIILTVINKWYWMGIMLPLLKGRKEIAFRRLKPIWGGYSTTRYLASKCYTPMEIRNAFLPLKVKYKRGYSILYPAWYQDNIRARLGKAATWLWKIDTLLNYTPFWSKGEYLLLVFE